MLHTTENKLLKFVISQINDIQCRVHSPTNALLLI